MRKKVFLLLIALLLVLQVLPMTALANQEYFLLNTQNPAPSQDIKVKYYFQVEPGNKYILALCQEKFPTSFSDFSNFIIGSKNLTSEMSGSYIRGEWAIKAPSTLGKYQLILVGPKPASSGLFTSIGCYIADKVSDLGSVTDPVTGVSVSDVAQGVMEVITTLDPIAGGVIDAFESVFGDDQPENTTLLKIPVEVKPASAVPTTSGTSGTGTTGVITSPSVISSPANTGLDINDLKNSGSIGPIGAGTGKSGSTTTPGTGGNPVNITNTTTNTNQNINNTTNNANSTINISGSTIANSNIGSNNQTNQNVTNSNAITVTQYVTVTINGQPLQSDVKPFINADGRTMLPVRAISEALGAQVQWDSATQTAILTIGDQIVKITIGQKAIDVDGSQVPMDTTAVIKDGRTLLPVRAIGEALGAKIGWDGGTSTVSIDK